MLNFLGYESNFNNLFCENGFIKRDTKFIFDLNAKTKKNAK